jgi:flagellar basal-body rod protein FlgB
MWDRRVNDTLGALERGMDVAMARGRLISSNVANAETPNYKSADVDFEHALQEAQGTSSGVVPAVLVTTHPQHFLERSGGAVVPVRYTLEPVGEIRADGNTVDLEGEMAKMTENQIRFQALTQALSRTFSKLRDAVTEGGRR